MSVILVAVIAGSIMSCISGNKSNQIKDYKYSEEKVAVTGILLKRSERGSRRG